MIKLSKRLDLIYDLIPHNAIVADVGTDHGWLIIKAVMTGKVSLAYGLDIAEGPLSHAKANVENYGLEDRITLLKMDGLSQFSEPCDTFVIAGMGAETIWSILEQASFKTTDRILIQSNTDLPWLRKTLFMNGFRIIDERFIIDHNKPVFILVGEYRQTSFTLIDQYIGPVLKNAKDNLAYSKYLVSRCNHLSEISKYNQSIVEEFNVLRTFIETE